MHLFKDRKEAGKKLSKALEHYRGDNSVIVLALPRGGVPIGYEIAKELNAKLDIILVRKLGVPGHEELAMGAIATGGIKVINKEIIETYSVSKENIQLVENKAVKELKRRHSAYRKGRQELNITDKTVILADDGLATGASMQAAVQAAKSLKANKIIIAIPVSARDTYEELSTEVDDIVCLQTPDTFLSIGEWYANFPQISDKEVKKLL